MKKLLLLAFALLASFTSTAQQGSEFLLLASYKQGQNQSGYDTNAQSFITAVETTTPLTTDQEVAINDLVIGLKNAGLWSKFHAFYPMIGGEAASHKWNLVNPQDTDAAYRLVFNGTVTHTSDGIQSTTNGWANTFIQPNNVLSLTSQSLYVSIIGDENQTGSDSHDIGAYNGTSQAMYIQSKQSEASPVQNYRMNASATNYTNGYAEGDYVATRGTGNSFYYKDGYEVGNVAHAGTLPSSRVIALMNTGFSNVSSVYSTGYSKQVIGAAGVGGYLTPSEVSALNDLVDQYHLALGRNVQERSPDLYGNYAGSKEYPNATAFRGGTWQVASGQQYQASTTVARTGTHSLRVYGGSVAGSLIFDAEYLAAVPVGEEVLITGWAYIDSGNTSDDMQVRLWESGNIAYFYLDETKLDQWQPFALKKTRAGTGAFEVVFKAGTGDMYIDDVRLINLSSPTSENNIMAMGDVAAFWSSYDIPGASNGASVTSWTDVTGQRTLTNVGTAPTLEIYNTNQRAVKFNEANALKIAEWADIDFSSTDQYTIIAQLGSSQDAAGTLVAKAETGSSPIHYQLQRNTETTNGVGANVNRDGSVNTDHFFRWTAPSAWAANSVASLVVSGSGMNVAAYQGTTGLNLSGTPPAVGRGTYQGDEDLYIGARGNGSGGTGYQYSGSISNVVIFKRALTQAEIEYVISNLNQ